MVLECLMAIIDNSLFSRNSDILPNRFDAQLDLVSSLAKQKEEDNPETSMGIMVSSGKICKIFLNPMEPRNCNAYFKNIEIEGDNLNFMKSIQIACLSLKHRINKNQKQRIIIFVGSPIQDKESDLIKLAKNLKKNNISIDIINMNQQENDYLLKTFHENVVKEENCIYHNINEQVTNIGDYLGNLGIFKIKNDFGNFNEDMDDQLALAIKMSMEAEEKRQEELKKKKLEEENKQNLETINEKEEEIKEEDKKKEEEKKKIESKDIIKDKEFLKDILSELKMNNDDEEIEKLLNKEDNPEEKKEDEDKK